MSRFTRELIERAFRAAGGIVEPIEENFLRATLPPGSEFNAVLDIQRIAFITLVECEEDVLAGREPLRPLLPGSYYLDRFLQALCARGIVSSARLPVILQRPDAQVISALVKATVEDVADVEITAIDPQVHRILCFHFRVEVTAIETSRSLTTSAFDLDLGQLLRFAPLDVLKDVEPCDVRVSADDVVRAYEVAVREATVAAEERVAAYDAAHDGDVQRAAWQVAQDRGNDLRRFDRSVDTLKRRGLSDDEVAARRAEIAAAWERRAAQVRDHYTAEGASVLLVAATKEIRPFHKLTLNLKRNGRPNVRIDSWFDRFGGELYLPPCATCRRRVRSAVIGDEPCKHVICDACITTAARCHHRHCQSCSASCHSCQKKLCATCARSCGICGRRFCRQHLKRCDGCNALTCDEHLTIDSPCGDMVCERCRSSHNALDCGHFECKAGTSCRDCRVSICSICASRCQSCNRPVCAAHAMKCMKCDVVSCAVHLRRCAGCVRPICRTHGHRRQTADEEWVLLCQDCSLEEERDEREDVKGEGATEEAPRQSCVKCGDSVHAWELHRCVTCERAVCLSCGSACAKCARFQCHEELTYCFHCWNYLCEGCLTEHAREAHTARLPRPPSRDRRRGRIPVEWSVSPRAHVPPYDDT